MGDNADRTMRELIYRLVAMAPEAPPFPEAPMIQARPSSGSRRRFGPVRVAALGAVVVVAIAVPVLIFGGGTSTSPATTEPESTTTSTTVPESSVPSLPGLRLPGTSPNEPAGEYGWTGALGEMGWMHYVVDNPTEPQDYQEIQIVFAVESDCFPHAGAAELSATTIAGYDGLFVEPYDDGPELPFDSRRKTYDDTTAAHALHIGDRTLCVYVNWRSNVSELVLSRSGAFDAVESIQAEPFGEDGIRIVFEVPSGWDTG